VKATVCCIVAVVPLPSGPWRRIRPASPDDATGIVSVLGAVAGERVHSAIDRAWTIDQERRYLESLSPREIVHVAVDERSEIVGLQILDRWSALESMAHVGQLGTFVLAAERRRGVGHQLWNATLPFALQAGYRKLDFSRVVLVRVCRLMKSW
jgi:L-amino acid N-acyltransferase YncA